MTLSKLQEDLERHETDVVAAAEHFSNQTVSRRDEHLQRKKNLERLRAPDIILNNEGKISASVSSFDNALDAENAAEILQTIASQRGEFVNTIQLLLEIVQEIQLTPETNPLTAELTGENHAARKMIRKKVSDWAVIDVMESDPETKKILNTVDNFDEDEIVVDNDGVCNFRSVIEYRGIERELEQHLADVLRQRLAKK